MPTHRAPPQFPAIAALILATLIAATSIAGISIPSLYAREAAPWRIQAIAQDWVDLLLAVPWLALSAIATLRNSQRGALLLASALAFTVYTFVIYAFAVHFNQLFLLYCAILGLAIYALISLTPSLSSTWLAARVHRRLASVTMLATAIAFAALWLATDLPASLQGTPPPDLAASNLPTNAVHVLDLALVLPAFALGGILLWRGHATGYLLATLAMGFALLMDLNLSAILLASRLAGQPAPLPVLLSTLALAALSFTLLVNLLRSLSESGSGSGSERKMKFSSGKRASAGVRRCESCE